jgi:RNA polymerase sigma-70 factor (ECF subfamily)
MDTDQLLDRVVQGDSSAASALLNRHRQRLKHMVCLRIDRRLARRLDPSDVVQDALVEAHRRLSDYAAERPIPFYPWLRRIAWERLLQMHRRHVEAKRRSVRREEVLPLSAQSKMLLAERLAVASSPSGQLLKQEVEQRVREAIAGLPPGDREAIVLKHLEELSFQEAAAVLEISTAAYYSRYYRAIQKLHRLLHEA